MEKFAIIFRKPYVQPKVREDLTNTENPDAIKEK